ncbi:alpha/beta hydrolase [Microbispora sp. RL4-1S]|uniref:Alpha/beta hydrolase n=1 Tax=Microbispora oryzae TaxID=2806554 RepID=A0A941AN18_9ACTN|nr:alpha/beta hydrolase [Microbispora oryzae]MBP2702269.1 alpha/beta hydrolase [Microbispora oryzae]
MGDSTIHTGVRTGDRSPVTDAGPGAEREGRREETRTERVVFSAGEIELVGVLRLPRASGPVPAVALTGPFTGVKEQVTGRYAERLAEAGLATLAFDHRGFGESGGRRGHEDSQGKLDDLRAAVTLLTRLPGVDPGAIGLVGICLGGGYAVRAAAADPRVRAVAGIAGAYNSPARFAEGMGIDAYRAALAGFADRYDEEVPAVAPAGGEAAMPGEEPYAYYGTFRSAAPNWENRVTRGSLHSLMTFDALGAAPLLGRTPLLVVHGKTDAYCSPELAAALVDRTPGPKRAVWLDCREHIDLYDVEPYVGRACEETAAFLHRSLTPAG